jgi:hypothetical protein
MKKFVLVGSFIIVGMFISSSVLAENPPGGLPSGYNGVAGVVDVCPTSGQIHSLTDLINFVTCTLMNAIVPLLVSLAIAGFVYGIIQYFLNPENEEKRKNGKSFMLWGLITLFVMVSIWGLVGVLSNTFLDGNIVIPGLPTK